MSYFEGHVHVCPTATMLHCSPLGLQLVKLDSLGCTYLFILQKWLQPQFLNPKVLERSGGAPPSWNGNPSPCRFHPEWLRPLSGFIHNQSCRTSRKCAQVRVGGTKWSKYKRRSQNTSRDAARPPLFIVQIYLGDGDKVVSCEVGRGEEGGAPMTRSHSTLAKQKWCRRQTADRQYFSAGVTVGSDCGAARARWPASPSPLVGTKGLAWLVGGVMGWVTSDWWVSAVCWVHSFSVGWLGWQSWTRRVYTDWLWL